MKHGKSSLIRLVSIVVATLVLVTTILAIGRHCIESYANRVPALTDEALATIDFLKAKNLMIVAHPDDETLWGGAHLYSHDYLVVCLTGGRNSERAKEFASVMEAADCQFLQLSYPDKVCGLRSNWKAVREQMEADIQKIVEANDWALIVTHNAKGEYGHQHHIMTHDSVCKVYYASDSMADLYVFGDYYSAKKLETADNLPQEIDDSRLCFKEDLLSHYSSQDNTVKKLSHMNVYEDWTLIEDR
ncbi:MAG TPA: PIG-L family deacetylase [Bacillota bacterium]|nr:PIG-L family deacetylase [Bacillota bacterium]HPE38047.1 PIG-L family deacetylase [Bacillota bacterium]